MKKKIIVLSISTIVGALFFAVIFTRVHKKSPQDISSAEVLKSLPYLTWVSAEKDIQKSGVTKYDRKRSFKGINIYCSRNLSMAHLIDMSGNILHTWSAKINTNDSWQHIEVCKNGDLLAIVKDKMLIRMDWRSNIKWIKRMRFHHDIAVAENKDIYAIIREDELAFFFGFPIPILNDYIIVMSSDGEIKKKISLFNLLKEEIPPDRFTEIYRWIYNPENLKEIEDRKKKYNFIFTSFDPLNIFHTNTIEIIDRNIEGLCKKGDLLISVLKLDLIGILDIKNEKIIWKWGPRNLSKPHYPTFLENGNILIFDNGVNRGYSRIVELDPLKKEIIWEYKSNPPEQFFSKSRGSSQKLPNGNTLITESDKGHVFEVTNLGEIVWEFFNPEIKKDDKKRAVIYRMMRITDTENYPCLKRLE